MTREEAIHYLERIKQEYDCSYEEDALNMAIQALEQITKIADIVDGTIDHFDRDDAMDMLYEIKGVIK